MKPTTTFLKEYQVDVPALIKSARNPGWRDSVPPATPSPDTAPAPSGGNESGVLNDIANWYSSLNMPSENKEVLRNALLGSATGATALGLLSAYRNRDAVTEEEEADRRADMARQAVLGSILGGVLGGATPYGLQTLGGLRKDKNEPTPGFLGRLGLKLENLVGDHKAELAGAGAAAKWGRKPLGIQHASGLTLGGPSAANVQKAQRALGEKATKLKKLKKMESVARREVMEGLDAGLEYSNVRGALKSKQLPKVRIRDPRLRLLGLLGAGAFGGKVLGDKIEGSNASEWGDLLFGNDGADQ